MNSIKFRLIFSIPIILLALTLTLMGFKLSKSSTDISPELIQELNTQLNTNDFKRIDSKLFESNQPYLIHSFSSWCEPCKKDHQHLLQIKKKYHFTLVGLIWSDEVEEIQSYLKKHGNPYDIIILPEPKLVINLGLTGMPENFVVDSNNKLIAKINLELTEDNFKNAFYPKIKSVQK